MKKIVNTIATFLHSQTIWIFASGILTVSTILMVDGVGEAEVNWAFYVYTVGLMTLFFSPVLVFSIFRNKWKEKLSITVFSAIWGLVFVLYPLIVWKTEVVYKFMELEWDGAFVPTLALVLLGIELSILSNQFFTRTKISFKWIKQMSLEKTILIGMIPLALLATEMTVNIRADLALSSTFGFLFKFGYYSIQFYVIFVLYYLFYAINHYVLINKVFKEKGLLYYGFAFVASLILLYPLVAQLIAWLPIVQNFEVHPVAYKGVFDIVNANIPLVVMLGSIPFILSFQWLKQHNEIILLEKEKSETELSLLKQQINPHFFFNTLNNLYALSLTEDERTPDVILQLSELMRYVIYKGKEGSARLDEEIKYIEDYIELQRIRLHKKLDFRIEKDIADGQISISPLLFIILVENAFKHGIELAEKACFLHIKIKSDENNLLFSCTNSLEEASTEAPGIGLDNLRRRLKLRYPNQHELLIKHTDKVYTADLKIIVKK